MIPKEQKEAFLKDYMAICRKHNVYVDACGCCGSPWLEAVSEEAEFDSFERHLNDCGSFE